MTTNADIAEDWKSWTKPLRNTLKWTSPYYDRFVKFTSLVDQLDFAVTKTYYRNTKERINEHLGAVSLRAQGVTSESFCRTYCQERLLEHFLGFTTLYLTANSRSNSGQYFLVFDIDDKDGLHQDCAAVAQLVDDVVGPEGKPYWETSTGGKGLHGWVVVRWGGSLAGYRAWALGLGAALDALRVQQGHGAKVEVKGLPAIRSGKEYTTLGLLVKAPRLRNADEFDNFFGNLRFVTPSAFASVVPPESDAAFEVATASAFTPPIQENSIDSGSDPETKNDPWRALRRTTCEQVNGTKITEMIRSSDAFESMKGCVLQSLQQHGTVSTPELAMEVYEECGQATGMSGTDRSKRLTDFRRLHKRYATKYDADKRASQTDWFTAADHDNVVTILKPLLKTNGIKRVDVADLAVIALLLKKNIASNGGECGFAAIQGFFAKVKGGTRLSDTKLGRYRGILVQIGWLRVARPPEFSYSRPRSDNRVTKYEWLADK